MSRISPAVEAAALVHFVRPGTPCAVCGEGAYRGGMWSGADGPIYLCSRTCGSKLLLLVLDALADTEGAADFAGWLRFCSDAFDRWDDAAERAAR